MVVINYKEKLLELFDLYNLKLIKGINEQVFNNPGKYKRRTYHQLEINCLFT